MDQTEPSGSLVLDEAIEYNLPDGIEIEILRFNEQHVIEFSAYNLLNEQRIKGFISIANGLEYYEEESYLGPVTLTRIR